MHSACKNRSSIENSTLFQNCLFRFGICFLFLHDLVSFRRSNFSRLTTNNLIEIHGWKGTPIFPCSNCERLSHQFFVFRDSSIDGFSSILQQGVKLNLKGRKLPRASSGCQPLMGRLPDYHILTKLDLSYESYDLNMEKNHCYKLLDKITSIGPCHVAFCCVSLLGVFVHLCSLALTSVHFHDTGKHQQLLRNWK